MADLTDITSAQTVKIVGCDSSGIEQTPVLSTSAGGLHANLRDNLGNELLGRRTPAQAIPVSDAETATYSANVTGLVAAASATDIFVITGSASRTVRIKKIRITGTRTTATFTSILLIRRNADNTGGTSTVRSNLPHDTNNPASTAIVRAYTANPTTLGATTGTGILKSSHLPMPVAAPGNAQSTINETLNWEFVSGEAQPIVLRGVAQILSINLNATTVAGSSFNISIEWTEE